MAHFRWLIPRLVAVVVVGSGLAFVPLARGTGVAAAAGARAAAGNLLTNGSFEEGAGLVGWQTAGGFAARGFNDPASHDGQWLANGFTTAPSGSVFQDVPVSGVSAGGSFVGSLWVESSDGTPFAGSVVLFGLGSSDVGVTYFSAGAGWTRVQVPLDVHSGSVTGVRFQLYGFTVGHNISFDGAEFDGATRASTSSLAARAATATAFAQSRAGIAGYTLIDNLTGASFSDAAATTQVATASVIKVPIAMALMNMVNHQGRGLTASESGALHLMITQSDNDAATQLWNEVGGGNVIALMRQLGATNTSAPSGGAWGFTLTTSRDLAVVLSQLALGVLGPSATSRILSEMHQVIPSQSWGIGAALPGSAIKNGWFPDPGDWRVNCLGIVSGTRYSLAVMTRYPISLGQVYGEKTCQGIAADLLGGVNAAGTANSNALAPLDVVPLPVITGPGMTADGG